MTDIFKKAVIDQININIGGGIMNKYIISFLIIGMVSMYGFAIANVGEQTKKEYTNDI